MQYYDMEAMGGLPKRLKPLTLRPNITDIDSFMDMESLYNELSKLNMAIYNPFEYILEGRLDYYEELYDTQVGGNIRLKQSFREKSLKKLMQVNLLKRLESSVDSFKITLERLIVNIEKNIKDIENFEKYENSVDIEVDEIDSVDDDFDEEFNIGSKVKVNLKDMNISG